MIRYSLETALPRVVFLGVAKWFRTDKNPVNTVIYSKNRLDADEVGKNWINAYYFQYHHRE